MYFLTVLDTGSLRSRSQCSKCLQRALSWIADGHLLAAVSSYDKETRGERNRARDGERGWGGGREQSSVSFLIRTLILLYQDSTRITSFNLNYLRGGPFSKYSHIGGGGRGSGFQHLNGGL